MQLCIIIHLTVFVSPGGIEGSFDLCTSLLHIFWIFIKLVGFGFFSVHQSYSCCIWVLENFTNNVNSAILLCRSFLGTGGFAHLSISSFIPHMRARKVECIRFSDWFYDFCCAIMYSKENRLLLEVKKAMLNQY